MAVTDLANITSAGYFFADFPTFLAYIQGVYRSVYGSDIYLGDDSQDGQFTSILAQAIFDTAALGGSTYNSFSPATAQGVGLARNVKINGLEKRIATFSTADLVIVGVVGTPLINAIAVDTLQQQWNIPNLTIPSAGTITVTASASVLGSIQALPNTITGIFTPTNGWQTVNNPDAATAGAPVETDGQLRQRQQISTANPSLTVFEGTLGAVGNVAGVTSVQGYENDTGSTDANGLPHNSISIVVSGGTDADVASAIQIHKTPGTQTYGTTSVPTTDSHGMPLTINFYRPTTATIHVQVTITPFVSYNSNYAALIQQSIADYVVSIPIGGDVVITKMYSLAYLISNGVQNPAGLTYNVVSIEIAKNGGSLATTDIQLDFNEITVCDPSTDVTVVT